MVGEKEAKKLFEKIIRKELSNEEIGSLKKLLEIHSEVYFGSTLERIKYIMEELDINFIEAVLVYEAWKSMGEKAKYRSLETLVKWIKILREKSREELETILDFLEKNPKRNLKWLTRRLEFLY